MSDIKSILKEATQDLLSEDVLKEIENAFNASVQSKVQIHVEKALDEQDEDYSKKLEHLLQAIDNDHTEKLKKVVEALDSNRAEKLKAVIEKYQIALKKEAGEFKQGTVNNVSAYLEAYLDEVVPAADIKEAVRNSKAVKVLENVRKLLGIDAALEKDSIKDAVVDGKRQIDEASKKLEAALKEASVLKESLSRTKAELVLEKKTASLPAKKKDYIFKVMKAKSAEFINENVDYAISLFDKTEKERLQNIKDEAVNNTVSTEIDPSAVVEESVSQEETSDTFMNPYLKELSKY